jgi:putative (di)nucleoside polyphosphate hydrolase
MGKKAQTFRASVGALVIDLHGNVLGLERADANGQWQMPQGGLDLGEEPLAAAKRELWEETGLGEREVRFLAEHPEWLVYELPTYSAKHGRGQAQKWFLFQLTQPDTRIDLQKAKSKEFQSWKWTTLAQLGNETIEFRKSVYGKLAEHFAPYLARGEDASPDDS